MLDNIRERDYNLIRKMEAKYGIFSGSGLLKKMEYKQKKDTDFM